MLTTYFSTNIIELSIIKTQKDLKSRYTRKSMYTSELKSVHPLELNSYHKCEIFKTIIQIGY